jgi:L-rhamnose isomerase
MEINAKDRYDSAREIYGKIGVDTDAALDVLKKISVSMHCWQGDDVRGFDGAKALSGGIQATGSYPGRAGTPEELMSDIDKAFSLIPGKHRLNLHACYPIFAPGEFADRDALEPKHFAGWVKFARERGIGLDFNPTFFSHSAAASGLTLSSPDENIRRFWINHCVRCIRISEYFAEELGSPCLMDIWIPDGYKDIPADRLSPRARFMESLDEILACGYDRERVLVCLESKVFGIGVESYTVGSGEFCLNYAAKRGVIPLMDNGHYHPTETVSDKISAMLPFHDKIALHITRPVRWDSDHVVLWDDETREMAKEIVRSGSLGRVYMGLDFFDASINRVCAWVVGMRSWQKALLYALLTPHGFLADLQREGSFTQLMVLQEELKTYPFGDVWDAFCRKNGVPEGEAWLEDALGYEREILARRGG